MKKFTMEFSDKGEYSVKNEGFTMGEVLEGLASYMSLSIIHNHGKDENFDTNAINTGVKMANDFLDMYNTRIFQHANEVKGMTEHEQ